MWHRMVAVRTAIDLIAAYMRACGFAGWASFWRVVYVLPGHEHNERLLFAIKYLWWTIRHGCWQNPYEIEARAAESKSR